jgi:hypothetical protein
MKSTDGSDAQIVLPVRPDPSRYGLTAARLRFFQPKTNYYEQIFFFTIGSFLLAVLYLNSALRAPHQPLGWALFGIMVAVLASSGRISKFIFRLKLRNIAAQPDYRQFLKYRADITEYERLYQEAERQSWQREQRWKSLDGWSFERKLSELLKDRGWTVRLTKGSGDEGIDIVLNAKGKTILVQCKAHVAQIPPAPVRELYGTLMHQGATEAWLVATSNFSKGARTFAAHKPIRLLTIGEILRTPDVTRP